MIILFDLAVHPLIQVPNQLIAAARGLDIMLECTAEASPKAINYWTRENGKFSGFYGNARTFKYSNFSVHYAERKNASSWFMVVAVANASILCLQWKIFENQ